MQAVFKINKSVWTVMLMVFIILLTGLSAAAGEEIGIKIPGRVEVNEERIFLGDIAGISCPDEGLRDKLAGIELGRSSLPGYKKEISRELIILLLKNNGIDPSNLNLDIPVIVTVKTASKRIGNREIEAFVRKYIIDRLNGEKEDTELSVAYRAGQIVVPDRDYRLEVGRHRLDEPFGRFSLPVVVRVEGEIWKKVFVGVEVRAVRKVYVARRDIEKGSGVRRADFKLTEKTLDNYRGEIITDWESNLVREGVVKYPMREGDILTTRFLEKPVLIKWGSRVTAEVTVGTVRVSTTVKVLENGKKGDYILVENPDTNYRFRARVVSENLVQVTGGG